MWTRNSLTLWKSQYCLLKNKLLEKIIVRKMLLYTKKKSAEFLCNISPLCRLILMHFLADEEKTWRSRNGLLQKEHLSDENLWRKTNIKIIINITKRSFLFLGLIMDKGLENMKLIWMRKRIWKTEKTSIRIYIHEWQNRIAKGHIFVSATNSKQVLNSHFHPRPCGTRHIEEEEYYLLIRNTSPKIENWMRKIYPDCLG